MNRSQLSNYSSPNDSELNGNGRAPIAPFGGASTPPYALPLQGDDEDDSVDFGKYLKAVRRRWPIGLLTLALALGGGYFYNKLQKPVYQSTATILVSTPGGGSDGAEGALVSNVIGGGIQARSLGQQLVIIKGPSVQRGALKRIKAGEAAELARFASSNIVAQPEADAISVQVNGYHPGAVASFANAICAEYIQQSQEQNRAQVRAATRYVADQLGTVRNRLDMASRALRSYREQQGTIDLDSESKALIGQTGALEANRRDINTQRLGNEAQVKELGLQMQRLAPSAQAPTAIVRTPAVEALKSQLTQLQIQRIAASRDYRPNSRTIRDIDKQLAGINAQLKTEAQTQVASWQPNPLRQSLVQERARLQSQIWAGEAQSKALDTSILASRAALAKLPERAYQLGKLTTDQATLQQTYQTLNEKYQALRIQEEARVANARVIAPAEAGTSPISPRKGFNLAMASLAGLLIGLGLMFLVDHLDDRVHGDEDVESATGLPILSHVAAIKEENAQLLAGQSGTSPLLESFRMLRTNITFAGLDEELRSIVVTSSQPGEGKSTSAANLATVVALGGKNVILVDCDLRRPTVHKLFGLSNTMGFSNVAAGMVPLHEALQDTSVPGLRVLTSGPIPPNPPELLDSRAGRRTLQAVVGLSDFAVFDCPPSLLLTDAQIVATAADAVLLVVSSDEANKRDIARTSRLVAQAGTKMLGVLFNKVAESTGRYGYYKYGKYASYGGYFDNTLQPGEVALNESASSSDTPTSTNGNGDHSPTPETPRKTEVRFDRGEVPLLKQREDRN